MSAIKHLGVVFLLAASIIWLGRPVSSASRGTQSTRHDAALSAMGRAAARARAKIEAAAPAVSPARISRTPASASTSRTAKTTSTSPGGWPCVDAVGNLNCRRQHRAAHRDRVQRFSGFNSIRSRSPDSCTPTTAGMHFVDGGQLPSPGIDAIGTTRLPQVFGDPDVKYVGGCTFIYSSIIVKKFSATQARRRWACIGRPIAAIRGAGPFEVTAATNPNGHVDVNGAPMTPPTRSSWTSIPDTGRVVDELDELHADVRRDLDDLSRTTSTAATPTWSARQIVGNHRPTARRRCRDSPVTDSRNAYVAWWRFLDDLTNQHRLRALDRQRRHVERSRRAAPAPFFFIDHILGQRPRPQLSVACCRQVAQPVPRQRLRRLRDQQQFQRRRRHRVPAEHQRRPARSRRRSCSTAGRVDDRAQWFPSVTVDSTTGRIHVFYYDQGIAHERRPHAGHATPSPTTAATRGSSRCRSPAGRSTPAGATTPVSRTSATTTRPSRRTATCSSSTPKRSARPPGSPTASRRQRA